MVVTVGTREELMIIKLAILPCTLCGLGEFFFSFFTNTNVNAFNLKVCVT